MLGGVSVGQEPKQATISAMRLENANNETEGFRRVGIMKGRRILVMAILSLSLFGCAGKSIDPTQYADVAASISSTRDNFRKVTTVNGPMIKTYPVIFYIRSFAVDGYRASLFQIYAAIEAYSVPDTYNMAYDISGRKLPTKQITTIVDGCGRYGCTYTQHVAIEVDRNYLLNNKQSGVRIQLSSKSDNKVIAIPAAYVQAYLDAVK